MSDFIKQNAIETSFKKGEPWVILTKIEQQIKEKIEKYGIPLGKWPDIKINYGIKTGCNEAFIISSETRADILKGCSSKNEYDKTDKVIRPILRGRDIKQGSYEWAGLYLIALVPSKHYKIEEFPSIKHYLEEASWSDEVPNGYGKLKLEQTGKSHNVNGIKFTSRKATGNKWFETQDQIAYMDDFDKQKILYSETNNSDEIKMVIDNGQMIPDKTLFIITFGQLDKLYSLLLSPIFKWYMKRTSPLLGEKGISMTKDSVLRFYIPKSLNIDGYNLTKQEIDYINEE